MENTVSEPMPYCEEYQEIPAGEKKICLNYIRSVQRQFEGEKVKNCNAVWEVLSNNMDHGR